MKFCSPLLFLLLIITSAKSQYYEFPTLGWTQGYEYVDAYPPFMFAPWYNVQKCVGDTVLNGKTYRLLSNSRFAYDQFVRQEDGKIYRYYLGRDQLLYDFSAVVGDTVDVYALPGAENVLQVVDKGTYLTNRGDNLIWMELSPVQGNATTNRFWLEGMGDQAWGFLYRYVGFETGGRPQATYDLGGPIWEIDFPHPALPFDLLYGEDQDQDWVYNYYPKHREIIIDCSTFNHFNVRLCDTVTVVNDCQYPLYLTVNKTSNTIAPLIAPGDSYTLTNLTGNFIIHHQYDFNNFFYARVWTQTCFEHDCDESNPAIHSFAVEIPYNSIDEDCRPSTMDDDLDGDGFSLVEDCDDTDARINPAATEVPGNGIDENCDGNDLMTGMNDLSVAGLKVSPNPVSTLLQVEWQASAQWKLLLYDVRGHLVFEKEQARLIDVSGLENGLYLLELRSSDTDQWNRRKIIVQH